MTGIILYPIALSIQLPVYIYILVLEKSEKLKELMKSHGMSNTAYIFTNYLFNFVFYVIIIILFWVFGIIINLRFFTQTNPITMILLFFGWGNALISLAFFFSSFLNTKRAAVIVGYIVALMGTMIGLNLFLK